MVMKSDQIIEEAKRVLTVESEAIRSVRDRIDRNFSRLVELILECDGKIIMSGIGKSGIICRKIAATLSSTGTPALFLHPAEALHGDLGIIGKQDLIIAISNSGESPELLNMIFSARNLGIRVASITGKSDSSLAKNVDLNIDISAQSEACPLGLAPTTSTTVSLAIGDALAIVTMELKGFKREDYAALHPGGNLGQRLKRKVRDFMATGDQLPVVPDTATLVDALEQMTLKNNLGFTIVTDDMGTLVGILTDGDIRRIVIKYNQSLNPGILKVRDIMTRNPKIIEADESASSAVQLMESKGITCLAIVDTNGKPVGVIHLHDVLGRGNLII
jgi:arabinose-5-phosphate isomerase